MEHSKPFFPTMKERKISLYLERSLSNLSIVFTLLLQDTGKLTFVREKKTAKECECTHLFSNAWDVASSIISQLVPQTLPSQSGFAVCKVYSSVCSPTKLFWASLMTRCKSNWEKLAKVWAGVARLGLTLPRV